MSTATKLTERRNRSRMRPKQTTGVVIHTLADARGFCEPLSRYVELPTPILGQFYNLANNRPASSGYFRERLTDLIHESAEFTESRKLLHRPEYQKRHGINHPAIYRKSLGSALLLYRHGILDDASIQWINNTHLMTFERDGVPSDHDKELSIVAASIELAARQDRGYITHIDILRTASADAQDADSPLSIPVENLTHKFAAFTVPQKIARTHVKPDLLFGIPYETNKVRFYAVEYDRSTEDMEPTKSLHRQSWLKKILMYSNISTGQTPVYQSYLGIPNLLVLAIFQSRSREAHFHELVKKYARFPSQFRSTVVPPIDPIISPVLMPGLYNEPVWTKNDGSKVSIQEGR